MSSGSVWELLEIHIHFLVAVEATLHERSHQLSAVFGFLELGCFFAHLVDKFGPTTDLFLQFAFGCVEFFVEVFVFCERLCTLNPGFVIGSGEPFPETSSSPDVTEHV